MLGGGFLQDYVIKRARELGYYVCCLDANPNAIGFKSANESCVINIVDQLGCLEYAMRNRIDGVLTAATDFSVLTMSYIAQELQLPGINYISATNIKNKAKVRKILFDANADDTGYSYEINSIEQAREILSDITFPRMVKPCDGSGSRGASRVDSASDFIKACEYAMAGSLTHRAVAEPFIIGKEYGVESFVDNGEIHVLAVMQKDMTEPPYYAELGHAMPSGLDTFLENRVKTCVINAIKALGVNHGSINMDILITDSGNIHIVDVGARMGGNLIGSHIVPIGTGIDYMGNMIRAALGDKTDWSAKLPPHHVATKLLALSPGVVKFLPNFDLIKSKYSVEIEQHLRVGFEITPYRTNLDGCGYVIAQGNNVDDCKNIAASVRSIIDNSIIRE
jgi:biotin carboxylase